MGRIVKPYEIGTLELLDTCSRCLEIESECRCRMTIYMIGHSNLKLDEFLGILKRYRIAHLYDVRSIPRSIYHPHFNLGYLKKSLKQNRIVYHHVPSLGGKPVSSRATIEKVLETLIHQHLHWKSVPCLMCSEGNPSECHRRSDLEPVIRMMGHEVQQILRDGTLEQLTSPLLVAD